MPESANTWQLCRMELLRQLDPKPIQLKLQLLAGASMAFRLGFYTLFPLCKISSKNSPLGLDIYLQVCVVIAVRAAMTTGPATGGAFFQRKVDFISRSGEQRTRWNKNSKTTGKVHI